MITDQHWMQQALSLLAPSDEVPIAALVVYEDQIIGQGVNAPISCCDPTAHAEIIALRQASQHLGNYRLPGATLYVTLEPCMMCYGAMVHARIDRLVYAASNPKQPVATTHWIEQAALNHRFQVTAGVCQQQAAVLLKRFFSTRR